MLFKKKSSKNIDKYHLYQQAVQSAEVDAEFLRNVYYETNGYHAQLLREDFCGTCLLSVNWLLLDKSNLAECYDNDLEPLNWGLKNNIGPLNKSIRQRVSQFHADARTPSERVADIRCAQNFSYWVFQTRAKMLEYFNAAYQNIADDGIFVIDLHGGPESLLEQEEETVINNGEFTYVWDQHNHNPINNNADLSIHFRFPDGSEMRNAFTYSWRIWGLAELRDILFDAGFNTVDCYWEGTANDGESGDGNFTKTLIAEACPAYVSYLVAFK